MGHIWHVCAEGLFVAVLATTQSKHASKMAFKFNMRDTHHPLNELWPPTKEAYELQIWKIKFSHVCFPILYMCVYFCWGSTSISSSKSREDKIFFSCSNLVTSTLQPVDLLKFCWNDNIFVPTPSLWNQLLRASGWSKQMLVIVSSNALHIKGGMKTLNSLKCNWGQWWINIVTCDLLFCLSFNISFFNIVIQMMGKLKILGICQSLASQHAKSNPGYGSWKGPQIKHFDKFNFKFLFLNYSFMLSLS